MNKETLDFLNSEEGVKLGKQFKIKEAAFEVININMKPIAKTFEYCFRGFLTVTLLVLAKELKNKGVK